MKEPGVLVEGVTKTSTRLILLEVNREREAQDKKWGIQHHPDGTGEEIIPGAREQSDEARYLCDKAHREGKLTWRHIATEEFCEAIAESDLVNLRKELIQQAAVLVAWIEDIDSRKL